MISDITQQVTISAENHLTTPTAVIGETITFKDGTNHTVTSTLQEINASANTITVNSISGTIGTSDSVTGSSSGVFPHTVSSTGAFSTGEIFSGVGSRR